jgi:hypothetical protein
VKEMLIRQPAATGTFYNLDPEMLRKQIAACFKRKLGPKKTKEENFIGCIVPHAGYTYSGPIAAWVYAKLPKCNYIIIGPNHRPFGSAFGIMKEGVWKTPLGSGNIDNSVAAELIDSCGLLEYDIISHEQEHSIEVQLPFLQHKFGEDFKFVPISVMNNIPDSHFLDQCKIVGKAISKVIKNQKKKWIIIASSDFSHYIPYDLAYSVDKYVIDAILKFDEKEFFSRVQEKNASICGFGPIAITMFASEILGAKKVKLLKYATSGDIIPDREGVVGYASIILK